MSVTSQDEVGPLSLTDVTHLWEATRALQSFPDEEVGVRVVDATESRALNNRYRRKDSPTNVLTFSYPADPALPDTKPQHDVALCLEVATQEAAERGAALRDYVALLLAHAFLHVTGLDHEHSPEVAAQTERLETEIVQRAGFTPHSLY